MKKTFYSLLAIAGLGVNCTLGASDNVLQPNYDYSGYWAYVWTGGTSGSWEDNNWGYLSSSGQTSLTHNDGYKPTNHDPMFVGYDFSMENEVQTFTETDTAITLTSGGTFKGYAGEMYLASNVILNAGEWGDYSAYTMHLGSNTKVTFDFDYGIASGTTFDYGTMTGGSLVSIGTLWVANKTVNLTGSYNMTDTLALVDLLKINHFGEGSVSCFDASQMIVTDQNGEQLTYTTDVANIQEGQFGLNYEDGFVKLVAHGGELVPEASSVLLSILGLGVLGLRRRR